MLIIGIDYHPSFQQIAVLDQETGEYDERRLNHSDGEAERFYRESLKQEKSERAGGDGGPPGYSRWFERLSPRRIGFRDMDWRCSGDQQTASTQTKDGPRGCPTLAEVATGKSLSSNLGTESGESGSAATALASASAGADAHADYESATGRGDGTRAIAGRKSCSANKDETQLEKLSLA